MRSNKVKWEIKSNAIEKGFKLIVKDYDWSEFHIWHFIPLLYRLIYLCVCISIFLRSHFLSFFSLSIPLCVCVCVCLSLSFSIFFLYFYPCVCACVFVCPCACICMYLSIYLLLSLSILSIILSTFSLSSVLFSHPPSLISLSFRSFPLFQFLLFSFSLLPLPLLVMIIRRR